MNTQDKTLSPEIIRLIDAYWRAANYLSVGQIYLRDNPLLKRPLRIDDIKHTLLIDRVPKTGNSGVYLKQKLADKLIEHRQYICVHGDDLPEIRDWRWGASSL